MKTRSRTLRSTVALAVTLALSAVAVPAPPAGAKAQASAGTFIVRFRAGTDAGAQVRAARNAGMSVGRQFSRAFPGFVANLNQAQFATMSRHPLVASIERDVTVRLTGTQSGATWGLDRIDQRNLPLNGTYTYPDTTGVATYVIDTGVRADHIDLAGRVGAGFSAYSDTVGTGDCNGHGTHVAGTVAGTTWGVAKNATVHPVRVLGCDGSGTLSGVIAGIDWAIGHHNAGVPAVANMSLGAGASSSLDTAVNNLINDGVTVVVAAGNSTADACTASPARVPGAITAAASDSSDRQASFSNFGSCVDLYAPGVSITSAWYSGSTATRTISGTSMAAPHVAGAAALILGAQPTLTPAQVDQTIKANATANAIVNASTNTANRLLHVPSTSPETPVASAPSAPTNVRATAGKKSASVSWTRASDGGSPLTAQTVHIYRGTSKVGAVTVSASATSVTLTGLTTKVAYSFSVTATNVVGTSAESARSNTITIR